MRRELPWLLLAVVLAAYSRFLAYLPLPWPLPLYPLILAFCICAYRMGRLSRHR